MTGNDTSEKQYKAQISVSIDDLSIRQEVLDNAVARQFNEMVTWYRHKQSIVEQLTARGVTFIENLDGVVEVEFKAAHHACSNWGIAVDRALRLIIEDEDLSTF